MNVTGNDTQTQVRQATSTLDNKLTRKSGEAKESLGKEDFLKLLMAQATHQDPLNPMDSQGMMNQLTAMGSLEQMINMNKQLTQLNQVQTDISQSTAYSFLDKDVTVKGGRVSVSHGLTPGLQFQIPRDAESVKVQITDKSGAPVRTIDLAAQGPAAMSSIGTRTTTTATRCRTAFTTTASRRPRRTRKTCRSSCTCGARCPESTSTTGATS